MIREFITGLQGITATRAIATPDVLLGASAVGMIVAHLIAGATAHGGAFTEALVATGPLCLSIRQGDPARLPPRLVTVFVAMRPPGIRAALGELSKAGQHGIVMSNPVLSWVLEIKVFRAKGGKIFCIMNEFGIVLFRACVVVVNFVGINESVECAQGTDTTFSAFNTSIVPIRIGHVEMVRGQKSLGLNCTYL
jgi:hypothetical protein